VSGAEDGPSEFGAWNPGIKSQLPKELLHLSTIFRSVNAFTSVATAVELHELTDLPLNELVVFRPERLVLHELLIRVTADLEVPDGSRIEDLGINFRKMTSLLLARHLMPHMHSLVRVYADARHELLGAVDAALDRVMPTLTRGTAATISASSSGLFSRLLARRKPSVVPRAERDWGPAHMANLDRMASLATDPLQELAYRTASRVMAALFQAHGCAWGARDLIVSLATDIASNAYCSEAIGQALHPIFCAAAEQEGYHRLPRQEQPVVINTKGASASGKSTLRPLQKKLARDIGVSWQDFALISPDIWRKQLLDYSSLGPAYKYAGAFTAAEVQIVDQKLDLYMEHKHRRGDMSHLLIDRFRFDSFAPDSDEAGSNLLTRFGQTVYLFFVITPPELLVERAWKRGLEFGRYKAVDDTLAHSVEANTGIPNVFFTWARRKDKQLKFEFLDNTVRFGDRPRSIAFGDNHTFNVLNVSRLFNIQRYGRINVNAVSAEQLYGEPSMLVPERNTDFLKRCVCEFGNVNFAEQDTGRIYLRIESGVLAWVERAPLESALHNADTLAGVSAVAPDALTSNAPQVSEPQYLYAPNLAPTLGQWGTWRQQGANDEPAALL
jgi:hypothetical protein